MCARAFNVSQRPGVWWWPTTHTHTHQKERHTLEPALTGFDSPQYPSEEKKRERLTNMAPQTGFQPEKDGT